MAKKMIKAIKQHYISLKRYIYEGLVFLWPYQKGSSRWISLVSKCLKVEPYGFLKTRSVGLYKVYLDPGDSNDLHYYFNKVGHGYSVLLKIILRDGDTVIDAGANVGYFSAIASMFVGKLGRVHAIDASPEMFKRLDFMRASFLDGPIEIHHCALWSLPGVTKFNIATNSGWSSLKENPTFTTFSQVEVKLVTLDGFTQANKIRHVKLLKLDIEGAEIDALNVGQLSLKNQLYDYVLFEAEPHRLKAYQKSIVEIFDLLHQTDYCCIALIVRDKIISFSGNTELKENCDYLFVRNRISASALKLLF